MRTKSKLSCYEIFAYGIGGVFINLAAIGDQFGLYYLTNVALLPAGTVGTIMLLTTFFDALNDPVIGNMADQCSTRIGKYRPFMLCGGVVMCIMMTMRFSCPDLSPGAKVAYYLLVLMGCSVGFSACCIPWQAMMSILSRDYTDRNVLLTVRSISGALVSALIGVVVLPLVERFGGGADGWQRFVILALSIGFVCLLVCQHGMRRVDYAGSIPTPPKKPLFHNMLKLTRNKPVMCVALAASVAALVQTLGGVCSMHYYQYVLGDVSVLSRVSAFSLPISIVCPLILPLILQKVDKKQLLFAGFVISMVKPAMIAILGENITIDMAVVLILISRVGTSCFGSALFAWIPECVDWTTWKEGVSQAALISAMVTFLQKVGRALGQGIAGMCLGIAGFDAELGVTSRAVTEIIRINGLYQMIGLAIALIPILLFPITREKGDEIRKQLLAREAAQNAKDDTL